ncbi:MAG: PHP domain-containing protein [Candidatus Thiodiazotropha lotti]|uniref:PHP domain-containing protein n=1 Tax=Candidatus Thiodiazotropha lotti TaxID=2792787 RepID=A0A9E4MZT3_9GAMM|nr:PHP domain-containing protein [Candidatus Thiodiazotropha lotti]MCG7932339.1 PHP domain-containing protein [Candidatus Thiodiazotropha lotti]MCG7937804.1 PHP domain-containing protein [Candidatus Thiodiazotropha lotti]MCW4202270.1 PHP domain-containing protein [Candidatus Thiodiazotropha lotti]MCW4222190.1 PHP domain-containing protein [Candidatus Thiodiazotropha lotti]
MFSVYDLHSHSTASDGTLSPRALVQRAAEAGVEVLALTDHDTTAGIDEASEAAQSCGLVLIPGVEVSVSWNRQTVHLVGLNVDPHDPNLNGGLQRLRDFREWRAEEIGRRLDKAGISGAYEGARSLAEGGLVSRTHFARFLVRSGIVEDERKVFKRFLVSGKPGHVPGAWASLEEAVGWIHAAGGQAVIAHPARYKMTRSKLRQLLKTFVALQGDGLEVVSGSHSRDDYINMAKHAKDFDLMASAGSDFHCPQNPWIELGRLPGLPEGCKPVWQNWNLSAQTELRSQLG